MDDCGSSSHSLFGHTEEEYIPDAESVYLHREHHRQPQGCTLAQCFQLYTKEEQVRTFLWAFRVSAGEEDSSCLGQLLSTVWSEPGPDCCCAVSVFVLAGPRRRLALSPLQAAAAGPH